MSPLANLLLDVKQSISGDQPRDQFLLLVIEFRTIAEIDRHPLDEPVGVVAHARQFLALESMGAFMGQHREGGARQTEGAMVGGHILSCGLVKAPDTRAHPRLEHELVMVAIDLHYRPLTPNIR